MMSYPRWSNSVKYNPLAWHKGLVLVMSWKLMCILHSLRGVDLYSHRSKYVFPEIVRIHDVFPTIVRLCVFNICDSIPDSDNLFSS